MRNEAGQPAVGPPVPLGCAVWAHGHGCLGCRVVVRPAEQRRRFLLREGPPVLTEMGYWTPGVRALPVHHGWPCPRAGSVAL